MTEDQAGAGVAKPLDGSPVAEALQIRDLGGDVAQGELDIAAGVVRVAAEAADVVDLQCEVELQFLLEFRALRLCQGAEYQLFGVF